MLTITEAAARLGLSPSTVRGQVQKGKIRAKRVGERVLLISEKEVERYRAESLGRVGRHAASSSDAKSR